MNILKSPIWTFISSSFNGNSLAYVYLWISKKWKVVYVGQTNDMKGTLGRALAHVGVNGTLRTRFENEVGVKLEEANDLLLVSYPLPQSPEYIGIESSYREAIEYHVQAKLSDIRGNVNPRFKLISQVRYTARASNLIFEKYADEIVADFQEKY